MNTFITEELKNSQVADWVANLPSFFRAHIFGIEIWQYIGIILYIAGGYLCYRIISWILGKFVLKILKKLIQSDFPFNLVKPIAKPISFLIVFFIISENISYLSLSEKVNNLAELLLDAIFPLIITIIAYHFINFIFFYFAKLAERTETTLDDHLLPLARKILKIAVIIFGVLFILQNMGVNITPLLAGASIGGLAIALASQETVKNLIGSLTIYIDRPFKVGDWIIFDNVEGNVEEIGVRSTRIRTFYNSVITIPNGRLADMTIDNMGMREFRRFRTMISITYETPPILIDTFIEGLKKIVENHPKTRKDSYQIHLNELGSSSINILFNIFFIANDITEELRARHEILNEIINLADELGVRFAFPTQTLHIESFPEKKTLTPEHIKDKQTLLEKINNFFNRKSERRNH